ncbi:hypothetical protein ACFLTE_03425 [Bacteroidota bacterium]
MTLFKHIILLPALIIIIQNNSFCSKIRSLRDKEIHHISLNYEDNCLKIPGNSFKIGISAVTIDGNELSTKGFLDGNIRWSNYKIDIKGGNYFAGKVFINNTQGYLPGRAVKVNISSKHHPEINISRVIRLNYETELIIKPTTKFIKAPGRIAKFGFINVFDNDMCILTNKSTRGAYHFSNYNIAVDGGYFKKGMLCISDNIFDFKGHKVSIYSQLKTNPEITAKYEFLLDYKDHYVKNIYASNGFSGAYGTNGYSGSTGNDGGNGSNGGHGSDGFHGHDISVFVDSYYDTILHTNLLKVRIEDLVTRKRWRYLVNPDGGSITIRSYGGDGGSGGSGGNGGNGGDGYDGAVYTITKKINDSTYVTETHRKPGGHGGNGGDGGDGGYGGYGGNGGNIFVFVTPEAMRYDHLIHVESIPGCGGSGGYGGSAGSGGNGGDGEPDGRSGSSGSSGWSGGSGYGGIPGIVDFLVLDRFYW